MCSQSRPNLNRSPRRHPPGKGLFLKLPIVFLVFVLVSLAFYVFPSFPLSFSEAAFSWSYSHCRLRYRLCFCFLFSMLSLLSIFAFFMLPSPFLSSLHPLLYDLFLCFAHTYMGVLFLVSAILHLLFSIRFGDSRVRRNSK